ncbi:hypothetical protein [Cellulomonas sp. ICMP 17802]|uniref:hypothetical protein n=1 Tax=Cellulomonas sp. ICMP 17802 TaxID=3239199 RepID=UPI00351B3154
MLKRLIIAAVGVVGLVVIGLGIASATVWRADDVLVATTSGGPHTLVTEPGVLELGGDPVTVKVSVPDGGNVVLAVGRDTDVAGWVGTDAHGTVTGLSGWHTLAVKDVAAPAPTAAPSDAATAPAADAATPAPSDSAAAAPATAADPTGSDLWVVEKTGKGSATLEWPAQEGRWSLLAVSTGESAPTLSLAWPRVVTTPWLWPCVVVGVLLLLLAGWLLLRDVRRRRAGLDEPVWHPVTTGAIPAVDSVTVGAVDDVPVLTRRQLREAAQARAARPRTGSVPRVAAPAPDETAAAPVPAASGAPSAVPTTRRALRPPTGSMPTVASPPTTPDGPAAPTAPTTTGRPVAASGWAPTPSTAQPDRPSAQPAPTASQAGPAATDPAQPAVNPAAPTHPGATPHGRPSWAHAPTAPSPAPTAPAPDPRGPTGWSAVPPPPGARLRPGSPAGPDAEPVHAGRPTWVRTAAEHPTPADENAAGGSRADAWRRAWGLPPTEGDTTGTDPETDATKEEGR